MLRRFPIVSIGALALLSVAAPSRANETVLGRVRDQDGSRIRACFYGGFRPVRGEEFDAFRNVAISAPKHETRIRRANVGSVRIEATTDDGCASAMTSSGKIQDFDWLVPHDKP